MNFLRDQPVWFVVLQSCGAILLYVGFIPLGYPGIIKRHYGLSIPEAHPIKDTLLNFLGSLKTEGLPDYRKELMHDIWFAVLFGAALTSISSQLFIHALTVSERGFRALIVIPIVYLLADVGEDLALLRAVRDPNLVWDEGVTLVNPTIARVARIFTWAKWLFLVASVSLLLIGGGLLAWRVPPRG